MQSRRTVLILLALATIVSPTLHAQTPSALDVAAVEQWRKNYELNELRRHPIYRETHDQCRSYRIGEPMPDSRAYRRSFAYSSGQQLYKVAGLLNVEEAMKIGHQRGFSPKLHEALQSRSFHLALQDCYPNDFYMQSEFIHRLIRADSNGRVVGGAAAVATWASAAGAFKLLGLGGAALVRTLKYVGSALGIIAATPLVVQAYRNSQVEKRPGPSEGFSQLQGQLQQQQGLPDHMIELIDSQLAQIDDALKRELSQAERLRLFQRRERLRLAKIDQLMVKESIQK